jgi:predicted enzyme related to lactoylglutathione lyase
MAKATGIGGVFLTSKDPERTKHWYETVLGIGMDPHGHLFTKDEEAEGSLRTLQWSVFDTDDAYMQPTTELFMVNYRVDDLNALVDELKRKEVQILDEVETFSYGKFLHILDCDGRKVELWEPVDETFEG